MKCEKCNNEHDGKYASGRFCSKICAKSFSTVEKRAEINNTVSIKLKTYPDKLGCKVCSNIFNPSHSREICCSKECKRQNKINGNLSRSKEQKSLSGAKGSRGKYKRNPESILDLSARTISKILVRLNLGCSRCGWNEASGDIHHIHGRKITNPDDHSNLTYLCPNCHRLFHRGKIGSNDVVSLDIYIGDKWKDFYYG